MDIFWYGKFVKEENPAHIFDLVIGVNKSFSRQNLYGLWSYSPRMRQILKEI